jgi:hypothetical protein
LVHRLARRPCFRTKGLAAVWEPQQIRISCTAAVVAVLARRAVMQRPRQAEAEALAGKAQLL